METYKPNSRHPKKLLFRFSFRRILPRHTATFVFFGSIGFLSAIALAWLLGQPHIVEGFSQLSAWQANADSWMTVPQDRHPLYLILPTLILFMITWGVMKISPQQRRWSKIIIVVILQVLTIRYVAWRSLATLNLSSPVDGIFSLLLLGMELVFIVSNTVQLYLMLKTKNRRSQADRLSLDVIEKKFTPSVAILITTYNEPAFIIRRTVIGCQNVNYERKTIYLLDDGNRESIKTLAQELGCQYITRPHNHHAKAGNLNNALSQIHDDLVAVFDADFIPSTNFLTRTVGFFNDQKIALVQTNQNFYNRDPIARNLGLENQLTEEVEIFSRHYQVIRDSIETMVCYGSSFVVRKSHLDEIGGFVTDSLSEDYFTGIRLTAKGYQCIYLDEKLSAGLAAENMAAHLLQRLRWSRGTLQSFFINSNPLTIPGLTFIQRLAHLEGILQWFVGIPRVFFLLLPIATTFLGVIPLQLTFSEWLYYFLPYYLISLQTYAWINRYSRSAFLSDLYSVTQSIPLAINVFKVLSNPFSEGFKVTPKGLSQKHFILNRQLAFPLLILLILNLISFSYSVAVFLTSYSSIDPKRLGGFILICFWGLYNLIILTVSVLIMVDAPKPDMYECFDLKKTVYLSNPKVDQPIIAVITKLSEIGAKIKVSNLPECEQLLKIKILEEDLLLTGKIITISPDRKSYKIDVEFQEMSLSQKRKLIKLLYGNSNQWKRKKTPGELQSIWLMLKVLIRPHFLQKR